MPRCFLLDAGGVEDPWSNIANPTCFLFGVLLWLRKRTVVLTQVWNRRTLPVPTLSFSFWLMSKFSSDPLEGRGVTEQELEVYFLYYLLTVFCIHDCVPAVRISCTGKQGERDGWAKTRLLKTQNIEGTITRWTVTHCGEQRYYSHSPTPQWQFCLW